MKVTAIANSNIALIKYWGKRDPKLMLPQNGSISMTLDGLYTITTVEFHPNYERDILILNGRELSEGKEYEEVVAFLNIVRETAGISEKAKVATENNFPTAAGLASSASGFAALALAASKAAGLNLDKRELSILARRGSGSASRSIEGGFVEWMRGEKEDGSDSYAVQIAPKDHWDFRMITTIVSTEEKKVKSRAGMAQTVKTCPFYRDWLLTVDEDLKAVREGILNKDFTQVGETAEYNCLKMHATMITTKPPLIYWNPATMEIIHAVQAWREEGLECYFTIDAGPNVKV
ncbi:diphosphomevalonate decarboxylase, partial [Candidatus Aerophobetes bacterium]